jgi:hypothetical protein
VAAACCAGVLFRVRGRVECAEGFEEDLTDEGLCGVEQVFEGFCAGCVNYACGLGEGVSSGLWDEMRDGGSVRDKICKGGVGKTYKERLEGTCLGWASWRLGERVVLLH